MNFKKIFLTTLVLVSFAFAKGEVQNTSAHMSELKEFYLKMGESKGFKRGEFIGYNKAIRDFKKLVKTYKQKIKALEAGKYFSEEGKITQPKIYKIKKNGVYSIKIMAPTIEKEFTAEDLFIIPLLNGKGDSSSLEMDSISSKSKIKHYSNGLDLPDIESINKHVRPNSIGVVRSTISVRIPFKSSDAKKFLEIFGSKYSETSTGYIVSFSNAQEKNKFCIEFTGDKTCEKISEGAL